MFTRPDVPMGLTSEQASLTSGYCPSPGFLEIQGTDFYITCRGTKKFSHPVEIQTGTPETSNSFLLLSTLWISFKFIPKEAYQYLCLAVNPTEMHAEGMSISTVYLEPKRSDLEMARTLFSGAYS